MEPRSQNLDPYVHILNEDPHLTKHCDLDNDYTKGFTK